MLNEQEAVTKEIDDLIGMDKAGRNPPLATENLLENTDGALSERQPAAFYLC